MVAHCKRWIFLNTFLHSCVLAYNVYEDDMHLRTYVYLVLPSRKCAQTRCNAYSPAIQYWWLQTSRSTISSTDPSLDKTARMSGHILFIRCTDYRCIRTMDHRIIIRTEYYSNINNNNNNYIVRNNDIILSKKTTFPMASIQLCTIIYCSVPSCHRCHHYRFLSDQTRISGACLEIVFDSNFDNN